MLDRAEGNLSAFVLFNADQPAIQNFFLSQIRKFMISSADDRQKRHMEEIGLFVSRIYEDRATRILGLPDAHSPAERKRSKTGSPGWSQIVFFESVGRETEKCSLASSG